MRNHRKTFGAGSGLKTEKRKSLGQLLPAGHLLVWAFVAFVPLPPAQEMLQLVPEL